MKKQQGLVIACALTGFLTFNANAEEPVLSGSIGAGAGIQHISNTETYADSGESTTTKYHGRISIPIAMGFTTQFDYDYEDYNIGGNWAPSAVKARTVHASYRQDGLGLIGAFYTDGEAKVKNVGPSDENGSLYGLEAQYYLDDSITLYGQFGRGEIEGDDGEGFKNGKFYRGVARYFPTDDILLELDLAKARTPSYIDSNDKGRFKSLQIKGEMKLTADYPLYGYASYRLTKYDSTTEGDNLDDEVLMLGFNYRFGSSSLKHNDRYGATLDAPLTPFRATSFMEALD